MRPVAWCHLLASATLASVACASHPQAAVSPVPCAPTSDSLRTPDAARVTAGTYRITFIATGGSRMGDTAIGALTLYDTSPTDRSPRTGEGPAPYESREEITLWGSLSADLASLGASLPEPGSSIDTLIPQPDSRDPIYPGVVVHIQNWQNPEQLQQNVLLIASSVNIRADMCTDVACTVMLDGPGVWAAVRRLNRGNFGGTWGIAYDSLATGGYFCADQLLPN